MPKRDLEKLLGGYAAGKLTEEERRTLFEAALHDPKLFAALAREQALKASHKQTGADEQHHGERDFGDDERASRAEVRTGAAPRRLLKVVMRIVLCGVPRGNGTDDQLQLPGRHPGP